MADQDIYARLKECRKELRKKQPLPNWTPEQWVAAIMIKLGDAAYGLHAELTGTPVGEEIRQVGLANLLAVAAASLDALEQLEQE